MILQAGLKLNIKNKKNKNKQQKLTKIMESGTITSWQIEGEKVEAVADFIFSGSKITADYDCSHEIKRLLLLGRRKTMTKLDSMLKNKDLLCMQKSV